MGETGDHCVKQCKAQKGQYHLFPHMHLDLRNKDLQRGRASFGTRKRWMWWEERGQCGGGYGKSTWYTHLRKSHWDTYSCVRSIKLCTITSEENDSRNCGLMLPVEWKKRIWCYFTWDWVMERHMLKSVQVWMYKGKGKEPVSHMCGEQPVSHVCGKQPVLDGYGKLLKWKSALWGWEDISVVKHENVSSSQHTLGISRWCIPVLFQCWGGWDKWLPGALASPLA